MTTALSSTESRALELLSSGIDAVAVAGALGVSESRISQIISNPEFAAQLAEARFEQLRKHNATDNEYDELEKDLIKQLKRCLPMLMKPMEIARVLQVINAAKRRGASAPEAITRTRAVVRLNLPAAVVQRFQANAANQVVEAEVNGVSQELVTMQSGNIQRLLNENIKSLPEPAATSRYNPVYKNKQSELEGEVWTKRQGREQNLMEDLGFTVEIAVESTTSSGASAN